MTKPAEDLQPVRHGHQVVQHDQVGTPPLRQLQGLAPVGRGDDSVSVGLQAMTDKIEHQRFVIGHEDKGTSVLP